MPVSPDDPSPSDHGTRDRAGNLPHDVSSFVGRRRELREVAQQLSASRLVTLSGVGGVGKTRLAGRVAADARRAFPDGTWFVDLTELYDADPAGPEIRDPEVLAHLVVRVLRLPEPPNRSPLKHLSQMLATLRLLLVLDSCERLLRCCAVLAESLLRHCPQVHILATSREVLLVSGETIVTVPPMAVPEAPRLPSPAALAQVESVALFAARATAALPRFELTDDNHEAVSAICRRLDGLPLAIELAAARIRVLTPQQILERLADRFALLGRGAPSAPPRQQTLRACLDWSFDMCSDQERLLWARLSMFAGGAELDAVERICADDDLPPGDILEALAALVDKSIVLRADDVPVARYRMLDSVREFGLEHLSKGGDDGPVRRRHRDWCLRIATEAEREWVSERQAYWLARLSREHANLRVAVEYCLAEPGEAAAALRIAVSLPAMHWIAKALFREGRSWLDRGLAQAKDPTPVRARALLLASQLAIGQGDPGAGAELLDQGEALARRLNAQAALAYATYLRGLVAMFADGDLVVAIDHFERALAALDAATDRPTQLRIDLLLTLGHAAGLMGDRERTAALEREVRRLTGPWDQGFYRARVVWGRALAAWRNGELGTADALVTERLQPLRTGAPDDSYGMALSLEVMAWIAAAAGEHARAATLLGAADTLWTTIGSSMRGYRYLEDDHRACHRRARKALGGDRFRDAFEQGRRFEPEQAVAYALRAQRPPTAAPGATRDLTLTRREREVAELVADGLSNKDIAGRLVISQRTAESHVENILTKLAFTSRAQIAAWITGTRRPQLRPER